MDETAFHALQSIQNTPLPELEAEIRRGERYDDLRILFGDELAGELQIMASAPPVRTLSGLGRPLVVILPGIMGSTLRNIRGVAGLIWLNPVALIQGRLRLAKLDPAGTADAEPAEIVASGMLPIPYLPLYLHLRWSGCDVQEFPYDWRRAPTVAADALAVFLRRLRSRDRRPVHLVCHSMGGLVARHYCRLYTDEAAEGLAQIVMIGPPNYGSLEAVRNLTVGGDVIRMVMRLSAGNEALAVARSAPGLYALLPAQRASYPVDDSTPTYPFAEDFDCYSAAAYQIDDISSRHLAAAQRAYEDLLDVVPPVPVAIIAGCYLPTLTGGVKSQPSNDQITFNFATHPMGDGDGTVPTASAIALHGAKRYFVKKAQHGNLPQYPGIRRAVEALVYGEEPDLPTELPPRTLSGQDLADVAGVPEAPTPGTLSDAQLDAVAERVRLNQPTPDDLALLARLL